VESGCESGYCPEEEGIHLCSTLTVISEAFYDNITSRGVLDEATGIQ
jgi:hypothetical protein